MAATNERSIRGKVAVAGVAETTYYRQGRAEDSEFKMCLDAIIGAAADAGIEVTEIDGFASYATERSLPDRIATALGLPEHRLSNLVWGGGGGGGSGAVANGAAAIHAGFADVVVVYRSLAQGQYGRFGQARGGPRAEGPNALTQPYGVLSPAQQYAMRVRRFMHEHGVQQEALRAVSLASYQHAQHNPRAVMHGRPLSEETYDSSRWIVEPFHLYDCCQENDGAAAMILVPAERARDLRQKPVYVLGAAQGSGHRQAASAHNAPDYATANFKTLAPHLYAQAGVGPEDVDVLQSYENFTGCVMVSIVEHGFCAPDEVNEFFTLENFTAPSGKLPLNTSGGNLAECYMHGLELNIEAVRQIRGHSTRQVPNVEVSMVTSGPMVQPVSSMILGSEPG